jgi:hypothetical protein
MKREEQFTNLLNYSVKATTIQHPFGNGNELLPAKSITETAGLKWDHRE